ncbi:hypothetical protein BWQ96_04110 [Gracilariopsis chorda]|uniref:Uncharacterized protein n=1 Tax=Gracilariopsis chorda TaxID=448386 RepID=A0A2V3IVE7_9FLOR|nr:hypothetical protein BWQ96_04110 [Gracilariopsis chorda]|eukprot:PXF46104.1 hypothetical protein BWQ96_04110 [Gracilariopsis chorda]
MMDSTSAEVQTGAPVQKQNSSAKDFTVDICCPGIITEGEGKKSRPLHCFQILILVFIIAVAMHELVRNSALMTTEFHSLMKLSDQSWSRARNANGCSTKGTKSGCRKPTMASSAGSKKERTHEDDRGKWPWTTEPPATHTSAPAASQKGF